MNLLRTIAFISWQIVAKLGLWRGGRVLWRSARMFLDGVRRPESHLHGCRMRACQRCGMFDSKWGTCGTPGETYEDINDVTQTLGCWCIVEFANRVPEKACWARQHNLDEGWPDNLMPEWWQKEQIK